MNIKEARSKLDKLEEDAQVGPGGAYLRSVAVSLLNIARKALKELEKFQTAEVTLALTQEEADRICSCIDESIGYMEDRCADTKYPNKYEDRIRLFGVVSGKPYDREAIR